MGSSAVGSDSQTLIILHILFFLNFIWICDRILFLFQFLYVQELGGGQLLLISGTLFTSFPPQSFRVYRGEGKEAIFSHDSDSHIPVIHSADALIFILFWAQPMPSHFFPVRKHQLCANLFLIPPNHPVKRIEAEFRIW